MLIKTSELNGAALDWAVMKAEGPDSFAATVYYDGNTPLCIDDQSDMPEIWSPSEDWSQGGPILERERIELQWLPSQGSANQYGARKPSLGGLNRTFCANGPTPLIAAMRCYVASKLGDTVDVKL